MMKFLIALAALLTINQTVNAKEFPAKWWQKATPAQVEAELKSGAMKVNKPVEFDDLPLKMAAANCSSPEVLQVLIKNGADVNMGVSDDAGFEAMINPYPLMWALECPVEVVKTLIEAGADMNVGAEGVDFAMIAASSAKDPAVLPYLIEKGVSYKVLINGKPWDGKNPIKDGDSLEGLDLDGGHILMHALYNENPVPVFETLLKHGVDINMFGYTYSDSNPHKPITVLDYLESIVKEHDPYGLIKVDPAQLMKFLVSKGAKHASEM